MAEWGYYDSCLGPNEWNKHYPVGQRQSPIDIRISQLKHMEFPELEISYNCKDITKVKNTGTSVKFYATGQNSGIKGGPVAGTYRLLQFHFHWGAVDCRGSEHTINGKPYSAEVHFVHQNTKYATVDEALANSDGLAVLGVFVEISAEDNKDFDAILKNLKKVPYGHSEAHVEGEINPECFLPKNRRSYACYSGSLTTPKFNESVQWINFHEIISMSENQINQFRSLYSTPAGTNPSKHLVDNFRPVQPLNGRDVFGNVCRYGT